MDSTEYWRKRALEREASWHKKSQQTIERELAREYEKSAAVLKERISILYARFAADNGMTYAAAVKLLQGQEYREWRMSMQEYLAAIDATGDNTLLRELNTLAMRSRVTRLDKLYSETLRELNNLGGSVRKGLDNFLTDAYKDNYYRGVFEIGHAGQLLSVGTHLDNTEIEKVLRNRWSGKNYSERIWKNQRKLANTLKDTMANALHRGDSLDRLSRQVEERMSAGHNDAVRLVQTELNYIQNQSALDSIRDAGMEWYEFLATLDSRTTPTCRDHDGHTYRVSEAEPGSNMPPLHPRCRSSISASLGPAEAKHGTRAARKEASGKTYYVPAAMKYEDWKAVYVDQSMTRSKWEKVQNISVKSMPSAAGSGIIKTTNKHMENLLQYLKINKVKYNDVTELANPLVESQVIDDLAGGDMTSGSCASLALAYIGRSSGLDVLDFRGGNSCRAFSLRSNLMEIMNFPNVKAITKTARSPITAGNNLLKEIESDKQYYFFVGRHAAIVRRAADGRLQYLELQSRYSNGWTNFNGNPRYTLKTRFGCSGSGRDFEAVMCDIDELKDSDDFRELLGYINTVKNDQKKGAAGNVK